MIRVLMKQWSYRRAVEAGIDIALTDISCHYQTMTRFGETMAIETAITKLTPARMELSYRMTDAETGALHAAGTSSHFFYDRNRGRPVALKKALPELYQLLQSLVQK